MPDALALASYLDRLLRTADIPDYANALNGLQLAGRGPVRRIATAVDFSTRTVSEALAREADVMLVHHGMFWSGLQRLTGPAYERLALLVGRGVAVYASHLPLDMHPELGNNALLARELGLEADGGFARFKMVDVGLTGTADIETATLTDRARRFAAMHGGAVVSTADGAVRRTHRWAICTGAGADTATIDEAVERGVDTLIVGEGPHHTAVRAGDLDLAIIYAGHYATETLGVRALGAHLAGEFGLEATFIDAPTGL